MLMKSLISLSLYLFISLFTSSLAAQEDKQALKKLIPDQNSTNFFLDPVIPDPLDAEAYIPPKNYTFNF